MNKFNRQGKNILIVVAHTDDETIGMGGTIVNHIKDGDNVFAISMTDGVSARDLYSKKEVNLRIASSINAAKILGFEWLQCGNFPDNEMDKCSLIEIIKFIENAKDISNPDIVYTHSSADLNIDHRILSQAVLTAFRPMPNETCKEIRVFEVPSATDYGHKSVTGFFSPNLYVDISDVWDKKLLALKEYSIEMMDYPSSRSLEGIKNLSKLRGNQVGVYQAEAFEIIRKIYP
ncbi:PIG-L family deacetylase [Gammaproteobacteria bacterium]|nr:PIG-L family deacetylase [Gammaproteobacteria bacterium]